MRRVRIPGAFVFVLVALSAAAPPCALACSCMQPPPLAQAAAEPGAIVASGRVGPAVAGGFSFAVERWFNGSEPTTTFTARAGNGADCWLPLATGDHLVAVWQREEDGGLAASICSRFGRLDDPDGQALLAEAEELFGPGMIATPEEPASPSPTDDDLPAAIPGGMYVGGAVLAGIGVLGLVTLLGRRTRRAGPDR